MLNEVHLRCEHDSDRAEVGEHPPDVNMLSTFIRVIKAVLIKLVADEDQVVLAFLTF